MQGIIFSNTVTKVESRTQQLSKNQTTVTTHLCQLSPVKG